MRKVEAKIPPDPIYSNGADAEWVSAAYGSSRSSSKIAATAVGILETYVGILILGLARRIRGRPRPLQSHAIQFSVIVPSQIFVEHYFV